MTPLENMLRTIRHDRPERVPLGWEGAIREIEMEVVEWPVEAGTDAWGVRWEMADPQLGAYPVEHPLDDPDGVGDLPLPDFSTARYTVQARDWLSAPDRGSYWLMGRVGETLFERAWMLLGMERLMIAVHENPSGLRRLLRRIADVRAATIERHAVAGCEAVIFADDYGSQENLLISPAAWRALIRPELARLYGMCRDAGLLVVHHSCGKIEAILPDLVEMGLSVWHPCQPVNDLAALKRSFAGRPTFHGAVDSTVIARSAPAEIRSEVRRCIRALASGGGFIAAPSHDVPFPAEHLASMQDEVRRVGHYGTAAFDACLLEGSP